MEQMQQHERDAFTGTPLADRQQIVAENAFLARAQPGHVEGQPACFL